MLQDRLLILSQFSLIIMTRKKDALSLWRHQSTKIRGKLFLNTGITRLTRVTAKLPLMLMGMGAWMFGVKCHQKKSLRHGDRL